MSQLNSKFEQMKLKKHILDKLDSKHQEFLKDRRLTSEVKLALPSNAFKLQEVIHPTIKPIHKKPVAFSK